MQICLCALVIIMPLLTLWAYRLGAGDKDHPMLPPLPRFKVGQKRELSQEALISRNIENYNGTNKGQVEIK